MPGAIIHQSQYENTTMSLIPSELDGTFGAGRTESTIITVLDTDTGTTWYAVVNSINVNGTYETLEEGVDVEGLEDLDGFTADDPIEDCEQLIREVSDYLYG